MKIQNRQSSTQAGSVLIITMMVCGIIGVTLTSYLLLTEHQNTAVTRSQTWNSAIVVSEAGVEDALCLLNKYSGNFDRLTNWSATAGADNWSSLAPGVFYVRRYVGANYYDVYITNQNNLTPSIRSVGYVPWTYYAKAGTDPLFASIGGYAESQQRMVTRRLDIKTKVDPIFNVAMAALQLIDFNGKNVETDSFDSADPNYSNGGRYDPSKNKDNGDVVTDYTITNALNVGNAKIRGQAKTGPKGTMGILNGSVGDKAWVDGGNIGVQPGHFANDMNVVFPDVSMPNTSWLPMGSVNQTIDGITYDYVFNSSGDYTISTFTKGIYVNTNVAVRLKITSSVSMNGSKDTIRLASGAQLKLYMMGDTFKIAGNGVLNDNNNAANFYYFGLPSNRSVQFNGNAAFTGAIYAPNADFSLGGGGNSTYDFVGASVTKSVKMNGHFRFHYDENLRKNGMGRGYIPTNWKES